MHFTPTSASWLNLVERFFAEITRKRIRRGVFHSIVELQMTINDYLDQHNADPKPFIWTASANSIIEKVNRGKQALESLQISVRSRVLDNHPAATATDEIAAASNLEFVLFN
jgi:hypothetical protein